MLNGARMGVVHSARNWLPQTETWLYDQVTCLPDEVENHVVCDSIHCPDQFPVEHLHTLGRSPWWQRERPGRRLDFLIERARAAGARVLHSHFGDRGFEDLEAARRAELAHVVSFYGLDVHFLPAQDPRWRSRYVELFERVDRVLCEGAHMAGSLCELGCPPDKLQIQHLGVRVDEIPFEPRSWRPGQVLRVLIAAAFREKKGIPYALQALGKLRKELPLELTIIGDARSTGRRSREQREKRQILTTLEAQGLTGSTRLLGFRSLAELRDEARRHHVFMSPSVTAADGDSEGGAPVSLLEMCASGIPVVSTRHCDIPGVVLEGRTGLLAEERDVEGLHEQLRWLVENPDSWNAMLRAARTHVEDEFNARVQGPRLAARYAELTD